ncbi:MAG: hypothetical protein GY744_08920 [Gammaproteobacteria bacterium]|nr:hypothetical protein [Gammaproteobacteria bacterium]
MTEKEVEMSPSGEMNFQIPQQEWSGNDTIQSSHFAGQQMFLKRPEDQPDIDELHYLGLMVSGFEEIEDAKFNAPEFARSVM